MGKFLKSWLLLVVAVTVVMVGGIGVLAILGQTSHQADRADDSDVVVAAVKETKGTASTLSASEEMYLSESANLTEMMFDYMERITKMHEDLIASYEDPANPPVDLALMAEELGKFELLLGMWDERTAAPLKFTAYDASVDEMADEMAKYRDILDRSLHEDINHILGAELQLVKVNKSVEVAKMKMEMTEGVGQ